MNGSQGSPGSPISTDDREISLGPTLASIPERLLLAHARGEVLFIAGAGVSKASRLPDFRELVLKVYRQLDAAVYEVLSRIPRDACNKWVGDLSGLSDRQASEVQRFISQDYDVVLGMLERRIDSRSHSGTRVRQAVAHELRVSKPGPSGAHRALMRLADRGGATTIITTNFDLLLEKSLPKSAPAAQSYALGAIPRPGRSGDFSGVLHIHGAMDRDPRRFSDLVLTDQDFGEFYLRRRVVPDLIYDAARLFHLVLVGYSANDPPMRYLLNAVAADGTRFDDLKERFAFVPAPAGKNIHLEDWKGRGITPIPYEPANEHVCLRNTLERWADLSPRNGRKGLVERELKRIVRSTHSGADERDRDLFDHLFRRGDPAEQVRLAEWVSRQQAGCDWLGAITTVVREKVTPGAI